MFADLKKGLQLSIVLVLLCFTQTAAALVIEQAEFCLVTDLPHANIASMLESPKLATGVPDSTSWQQRTLPDYWDISGPKDGGQGWYRMSFTLSTDELNQIDDWAIYIPRHSRSLDIYLNEQRLGTTSVDSQNLANNWLYPFLFSVPKSLLQTGENQLHIYLSGYGYNASLSKIHVAEKSKLNQWYQWRSGFHITIAQVTMGWMLVLCVSVLFFWYLRPKEIQYLWFSLSCICGALYSADRFVRDLPDFWSAGDWNIFFNGVVGWHLFFITLFLHQFLRLKKPILEYTYLGVLLIYFFTALFLPDRFVLTATSSLHVVSAFFGIYMVYISYVYRDRNVALEGYVVFGIFSLVFLLNINDFWLRIVEPPHMTINLLQWSPILLSLAMFWLVLSRLFHSLVGFETLNSELQVRVEEKTQQLVSLEKSKILQSERQRMMTEFHDGIGGYLVNAINLLRNREQKENDAVLFSTLSNALNDLRYIISNLAHEDMDIGIMLGTFRERIEPILSAQSIQLVWQVSLTQTLPELTSANRLNVLRILQEACTNIIKHAEATQVCIRTTGSTIEIEDNGRGISGEFNSGIGIESMKKRAIKLGARLDVFNHDQGTCIKLTWRKG